MNEATITFKGKELAIVEWALQDLFEGEEKALETSKWQDKVQDQYCDSIFELLERVRRARNCSVIRNEFDKYASCMD